jgi:hypothetical protein
VLQRSVPNDERPSFHFCDSIFISGVLINRHRYARWLARKIKASAGYRTDGLSIRGGLYRNPKNIPESWQKDCCETRE